MCLQTTVTNASMVASDLVPNEIVLLYVSYSAPHSSTVVLVFTQLPSIARQVILSTAVWYWVSNCIDGCTARLMQRGLNGLLHFSNDAYAIRKPVSIATSPTASRESDFCGTLFSMHVHAPSLNKGLSASPYPVSRNIVFFHKGSSSS